MHRSTVGGIKNNAFGINIFVARHYSYPANKIWMKKKAEYFFLPHRVTEF